METKAATVDHSTDKRLVVDLKKDKWAIGRSGGRYVVKTKSDGSVDPSVKHYIAHWDYKFGEPKDSISTGKAVAMGMESWKDFF